MTEPNFYEDSIDPELDFDLGEAADKLPDEDPSFDFYNDQGPDFQKPAGKEGEYAKRARQEQDPSMKNIDLELEIANLAENIRQLFSKEIEIAQKNFEKRFKNETIESKHFPLKKIERRNFSEFDSWITREARFLAAEDKKPAGEIRLDIYLLHIDEQNNDPKELSASPSEGYLRRVFESPLCLFTNEYRNSHFRLLNTVLGLMSSDHFMVKIFEQLDAFEAIKKDFETTVRLIAQKQQLELDEGEIGLKPELTDMPKAKFRFGQAFKSVFQGFDFEFVCRRIFVICAFKQSFIKLTKANQDKKWLFKIRVKNSEEGSQKGWLCRLMSRISELFNFTLEKMAMTCFEPKPVLERVVKSKTQSRSESAFHYEIDLDFIQKLALKEMLICAQKEILDNFVNIECTEEVLFFWLMNNLVQKEYCPYVYCLKHFSESLLDLNAALLNLKHFNMFSVPGNVEQLIPKASEILKPHGLFDSIIEKFKLLTLKKKYFEYKYDLFALLEKCRFQTFKFNSVDEIFRALEKLSSVDFCSKLVVNYQRYKQMQPQLYSFFKKILKRHLLQLLPFNQSKILFELLNKSENVFILKRIDNSLLIQKFGKTNRLFLSALDSQICGESLYLLFVNRLTKEKNLQGELEAFLQTSVENSFTICANTIELRTAHLLSSESVRVAFVKKTSEEQLVLNNTVCFANIKSFWRNIQTTVNDLLNEHEQNGQNADVSANLRFFVKDQRHLVLEEKLKNEAKNFRRLKPELVFEVTHWSEIGPLISQMHWKVQNGLFTWYCIFIASFDHKRAVLELLEWLGVRRIKSRVTAIKFFGIISKFFKFLDDAKHLDGFEQEFAKESYFQIPFEIMIDIDNAFGFSDTTRQENSLWDKEFFEHLYEWMNRRTTEVLFEIDVTKDFELAMDHLLTDFARTTSIRTESAEAEKLIFVEPSYFSDKEGMLFGMFRHAKDKSKLYCFKNTEEEHKGQFSYKTFSEFAGNFFNFSAEGSAQTFKVKMRETEELKTEKVNNFENYINIKNKFKGAKQSETEEKTKTVSKTICFGITGEALPKILYWVFGPDYCPALNLHIKKEPKKLRHVINADLVSFIKQTYIHDWLISSLSPVNKLKINSLLDNRERLIFFHRLKTTCNGEKWCVPIDLKDFHQHFGRTHYQSFTEILKAKAASSVLCGFIKEDFRHILATLATDLSTGRLQFNMSSLEENLFSKYAENKKDCSVLKKERKPKEEGEPASFSYTLQFTVNNGLMSGWKLTSLFGSLFNLTLNHMAEFFGLVHSSDLVFDLNVLGDDTHFKRRFLTSGLNHIAFVNMLNKIAHPDKQIVSTVSSEFLKKKINTVAGTVRYSNVRTLTTLLFQKDNVKRIMNDKNFIKDNLDLWNLFLVRIKDPRIVNLVLLRKYFHKFFANLMNFERNKNLEDIDKLVNSPTFFVGFLPGPLRSFKVDFNKKQSDINEQITNYSLAKSMKIYELDVDPGHCKGITENVTKIVGHLRDRINSHERLMELQRRLVLAEAEEIINNTGEFFEAGTAVDLNSTKQPGRRVHLNFEKIGEGEETLVYGQSHQEFDLDDFVAFSLAFMRQAVVGNRKLTGLIGELIYHNESVSGVICNALRQLEEFDSSFFFIINSLKNLKKQTDLENPLLHKFVNKFDKNVCLKLTTSNKHAISVSRNYTHDEIIGFLNCYFSKLIVFYMIEKVEIDSSVIERFLSRVNISLDYYLHQFSERILAALEKIVSEKIKDFNGQ